MSDNSYRIRTTVGGEDNVINVNLKQGVKTLNILSLEINPEDTYDVQTSDYGVIVGRVLANEAFGVPNVKVSVFVPIEEGDEDDYIISNEYPFKTPQSRDINGVKYNLVQEGKNSPGTFLPKNMLLDNDGCIEVFDKYWKYTTTTNESGDYMIFGVPTGSTQIHYDCDLSDIGIISQHPYDFVAKGYDVNLFESMDKFTSTNLDSAVHIISQDRTVFVYPFWGDKDANKIGITRADIDINYKFEPFCVFMGSSITDPRGSYIGVDGQPNGSNGRFNSLATSTGDIEVIRKRADGTIEELKENVVGIIDGNGVWCYQIPMNLDRIGTDEYGNMVAISDPERGIPTRARVRFRISLTDAKDETNSEYTAKILVPCNPPLTRGSSGEAKLNLAINTNTWKNFYEFGDNTPDSCFRDLYWGKVYSIKQYYPRFQYEDKLRTVGYGDYIMDHESFDGDHRFSDYPYVGKDAWRGDSASIARQTYDFSGYPTRYAFKFSCISSIDNINGLNSFPYNTMYAGAEEHIDFFSSYWFIYHFTGEGADSSFSNKGLHFCFENDWINGCLYFPRVIIRRSANDAYEYFGDLNDNGSYYLNLYISGRHQYVDNGYGGLTIPDRYYNFVNLSRLPGRPSNRHILWPWYTTVAQENNLYVFSRCRMYGGLLTRKETMLGQSVFYYRCGSDSVEYRRLYATDIILLGNLEDIYDSLPKLYNSIPPTTAIFPPITPSRTLSESGMTWAADKSQLETAVDGLDDERVDIFGNTIDTITPHPSRPADPNCYYDTYENYQPTYYTANGYQSEYAYALFNEVEKVIVNNFSYYKTFGWTNRKCWIDGGFQERFIHTAYADADFFMRMLNMHYSLFFGVMIAGVADFLTYMPTSFVNTSRICELDVHNDSAFKVNDSSGKEKIIPTNGMIDAYDISTNENRSHFASMNYDITKFEIDNIGYRKYIATPLTLFGFDGRLLSYTTDERSNGITYAWDFKDSTYLLFRYGDKLIHEKKCDFYDTQLDYCNGDIILSENSFYFYFGFRTGFSAIDVLKQKYVGKVKEDIVETNNLSIEANYQSCNSSGEIVVGFSLRWKNMTPPVDVYIYKENSIVYYYQAPGELAGTTLPVGIYNAVVIDSNGKKYERYFSLTQNFFDIKADSLINEATGEPELTFISIDGDEITRVEAANNSSQASLYVGSLNKYKVTFSSTISNVKNNSIIVFQDGIYSVDAMLVNNIETCFRSNAVFVFSTMLKPELSLNNIPVKYIKYWKNYVYSEQSTIDYIHSLINTPDSVFGGFNYYVWDSVKTAHPLESIRNYKFSEEEDGVEKPMTEYENQLEYVSNMCSCVFGGYDMQISDSNVSNDYSLVTISPLYAASHYWPTANWGKEDLRPKIQFSDITGMSNTDNMVPHIVGSNFPRSEDSRLFLKIGALNDDGSLSESGYVNNRVLRNNTYGAGDGIFGIQLFGVKNKKDSTLDKPGELKSTPDVSLSGVLYDNFYLGDGKMLNYYGIRTVDKRLDYQFVIKTPLIMPSGYSLFDSLQNKALSSGKMKVHLYGGFRLNYDNETKNLTSYNNTNGLISDGPNFNAKLFSESIVEDGNTTLGFTTTKERIWGYDYEYSSEQNDDVDYVINEIDGISNKLNGNSHISLNFVNCSTIFGNGSVSNGDSDGFEISYESAILMNEKEEDDFDVSYVVSGASSSAFTEFRASLSETTLSFNINKEEYWDDITCTDCDTQNLHDFYPEWAKLYENDFPYSQRNAELAVYLCKPTSENNYEILNGYTLDMVAETNQSLQPLYDSNKFITPYYVDGDFEDCIIDEDSKDYYRFVINTDNENIIAQTLPSNSFLIIPTRRVCASEGVGTLLKQGISYNVGYTYFTGSISVKANAENKTATIRLNTPLRGSDGLINYNITKLKNGINWHTIGDIRDYWSESGYIDFDGDKLEFTYNGDSVADEHSLFFSIENGLTYKITIHF